MIKRLYIALLFAHIIPALSYSQESDPPRTVKNVEPFVIEQPDSRPKIERLKEGATMIMQTEYGKIQVTCGVENIDFASQCQAEREKIKKNKDPKKSDKSKKDSHAPKAKVTIRWSSDK